MDYRLQQQQQQLSQSSRMPIGNKNSKTPSRFSIEKANKTNGTTFPLFFDSMTDNASKNYILNQSRFNFKQKMDYEKAARSCADLARLKFVEELKSGRKYNRKMLNEHHMLIEQEQAQIEKESAKKRVQKINLRQDLHV